MLFALHHSLRVFAAGVCGLVLVAPALDAQTIQRPNPGTVILKTGPHPEAADRGLGMALLSAFVAADGSLIAGNGVTATSHFDTGGYAVDFDRDVSGNCTYAMVNMTSASQLIPRITVRGGVELQFNLNNRSDGALADGEFSVIVFCPN